MHAFLVNILPDNYPPSTDTLHLIPEDSLGIAEVRQLQTFLSKKPLVNKQNVVVIHNAEKLTLPAQQALLKTLEEPPGNAQLYLVTSTPESLLPTILSRVQVIDASMHSTFDPEKVEKAKVLLEKLQKAKKGERLAILDTESLTRDTALDFLANLEFHLHQNLAIAAIYPQLVLARKYLKANVNVKLCMDNFALNLPNSDMHMA